MSSLWDCEKCGYNHYEVADECKNCGTASNLPDMVNEPPHYKDASGIECIEVTQHMSFCGGNCFKYLYRAGKKGSTVEDLKKAAWYAAKADEFGEQVTVTARNVISVVANNRPKGNVRDAMVNIMHENWKGIVALMGYEIARLESE